MKSIEQSKQITKIYHDLNKSLFDDQLASEIYVGVGNIRTDGYYIHSKWDEKTNTNHDDQILINENLLNESKDIWLSILTHQMIHKWQHDSGSQKPSKHYHNKEYVEKAKSIGLIMKCGDRSEQSIDPDGKFMQAIKTIDVEDLAKPRNVISQLSKESKNGKRFKFVCLKCGQTTDGKFDLKVDCHYCKELMVQQERKCRQAKDTKTK
ncbi:hypothetical protein H6G33_02645 [Calothrix sp. FACHB-1219]|uniref:SprT-like domain-containing protein n=1 Tax=unclassified Calothrix TaxID=2619626 RepID=UPI001681F56F|nr:MULTISPECIES: SprT-like domain-containing protein [unclassified Calothrix]MBD2201502.1 hypothetical protein [Calothrix sp. FACHB-168]MBD2215934.1 hypothetical protein [Calothrix sp. FACHB-1219]